MIRLSVLVLFLVVCVNSKQIIISAAKNGKPCIIESSKNLPDLVSEFDCFGSKSAICVFKQMDPKTEPINIKCSRTDKWKPKNINIAISEDMPPRTGPLSFSRNYPFANFSLCFNDFPKSEETSCTWKNYNIEKEIKHFDLKDGNELIQPKICNQIEKTQNKTIYWKKYSIIAFVSEIASIDTIQINAPGAFTFSLLVKLKSNSNLLLKCPCFNENQTVLIKGSKNPNKWQSYNYTINFIGLSNLTIQRILLDGTDKNGFWAIADLNFYTDQKQFFNIHSSMGQPPNTTKVPDNENYDHKASTKSTDSGMSSTTSSTKIANSGNDSSQSQRHDPTKTCTPLNAIKDLVLAFLDLATFENGERILEQKHSPKLSGRTVFRVHTSTERIYQNISLLEAKEKSIKLKNNIQHLIEVQDDTNEIKTFNITTTLPAENFTQRHFSKICFEISNCYLLLSRLKSNYTNDSFNVTNKTSTFRYPINVNKNIYCFLKINPDSEVYLQNGNESVLKLFTEERIEPIQQSYLFIIVSVIAILLIMLLIVILLYLCFAYLTKRYPFEILKNAKHTSTTHQGRRELTPHYKQTKLKKIRSKMEAPSTMQEEESPLIMAPNPLYANKNTKSLKKDEFEDYVMNSLGNDPYNNDLTRQYKNLGTAENGSCSIGQRKENHCKNRYKNIIPYNNNRVILDKNDQSDYINASYIDGYSEPKAFIATQAPLKNTLADFWWMVWQEKVINIIMLTALVESGTVKSEKYWPDCQQKIRFGDILIEAITERTFSDYIQRVFEVSNGEEKRTVQHLQYTTWPDHGVPVYPQNFTPFVKKVLAMPQTTPILVHCIAGCGRTGTLILCDIVLRGVADKEIVDFEGTLKKMRQQRKNMVNNVNQYVFAHFVIVECLFGVDFSISVDDNFQNEIYKVLRKTTIKPVMQHLDKLMDQFKKRQANIQSLTDDHKRKNRVSTIIPGLSQAYLESGNYINAVMVDCYRCPRKFIVTQLPLPHTVDDFWQLVKEYEINTIVCLNDIEENDPTCPEFWNESSENTRIEFLEEVDCNAIINIIKVKVTDLEAKLGEKTVNIIKVKGWKKGWTNPRNIKDLIVVWKETFTTSWRGDSKIVVTCYDGATASGLFVALCYLLEKINYEQVCDVCSAIRTVRQNREQFVQEWGQIEFMYKAAKVYIEDFENYDNFKE